MSAGGHRRSDAAAGVEIERKFLLRGMPAIPRGAEVWRIEQGYLPEDADAESAAASLRGGRLRRIVHADGRVTCFHTRKEGAGLVRQERETAIDEATFRAHWPQTVGARLRKTRHRARDGNLIWEIDVFEGIDHILAEVELPGADADPTPPPWLAAHIEREVTDDPAFTNRAIALRQAGA